MAVSRVPDIPNYYVCTSSTRPATPPEGMKIFETDTDREYTYTGSVWIEVVRLGAWNTYTPTLSQGASTNITKTVNSARYIQMGKTVIGQANVTASAAGTAGSAIVLTLPVTALSSSGVIGTAWYYDNGLGQYVGSLLLATTTTFAMYATAAAATAFGVTPAITVASGDIYVVQFTYEAA